MDIGTFFIHRKEQFDLEGKRPIICIHKRYDKGNGTKRIFCLWFKGRKLNYVFSNPLHYRW